MSNENVPKQVQFTAKGTVVIRDKHGNIKSTLEVTDIELPAEEPATEDETNADQ